MNIHTIQGDRDGETYSRPHDLKRLNGQAKDIWDFMSDGRWHTPDEIERQTGHNWAAASARLRDFRKSKFGGSTVDRMNIGNGVFAYRLTASPRVSKAPFKEPEAAR
jgi:hypothetical protein